MLTEQQEQKLMTEVLRTIKDRATKTEISKNTFYTLSEESIRRCAFDMFAIINRNPNGIIK